MIEITKIEELQYIVNKDPRVILVVFTSNWCTPCNLLIPQLQELEKRYANKCLVINIDIFMKIGELSQYLESKIYDWLFPVT
jgi:thiol-disulfide isomerase/thioredoxin